MSRTLRAFAISVATLISLAMAASAANALTVSPAGNVTATSGATRLTLTSLSTGLTCTSSIIAGTISASGTGTVPSGSARFNGCNSGILGPFTVTQNGPWNLRVLLLASPLGVALQVTIPSTSLITLDGVNCDLVVEGSNPATITLLSTVAALPFATSGRLFPVINSTGLRIQQSNCATIPVGLGASYSGTYAVSPNQTVSG